MRGVDVDKVSDSLRVVASVCSGLLAGLRLNFTLRVLNFELTNHRSAVSKFKWRSSSHGCFCLGSRLLHVLLVLEDARRTLTADLPACV